MQKSGDLVPFAALVLRKFCALFAQLHTEIVNAKIIVCYTDKILN